MRLLGSKWPSRLWPVLLLTLAVAAQDTQTSTDSTDATTSSPESMPALATPTSDSSTTGMPTLTSATSTLTSSTSSVAYPTITVPPTDNAPYMQTSNMPEGTVFIVVGAILGFMAVSVLAWRGLVAWSLHRSVNRAAMHQSMVDAKSQFRPPPVPFYKYSDRDSALSINQVSNRKKAHRKSHHSMQHPAASSQSLFYSPTAGSGLSMQANRGSQYFPSGYYAAGASAPAGGTGVAHLGGDISMTNLHPQGTYSRGSSPSDSPDLPARRHGPSASASSLNLSQARPPSAYLNDLFDEHGNAQGQGSRF